jgi:hypothetical protein
VIDVPAKEALAFKFAFCSREKMKAFRSSRSRARLVAEERAQHDWVTVDYQHMPSVLVKDLHFCTNQVCAAREDGALLFACVPAAASNVDYGFSTRGKREAKMTMLMTLEPLGERQCKVRALTAVEMSGKISSLVLERMLPRTIKTLADMRTIFERDEEVDAEGTAAMKVTIRSLQPGLGSKRRVRRSSSGSALDAWAGRSPTEEAVIAKVTKVLDAITDDEFEELSSPDPFVSMGAVTGLRGGRGAVLRSRTVRPAPPHSF